MEPWYKGFTGDINWNNRDRDGYNITGKLKRINHDTIEITELPLRKWTRDYKNFLEKMKVKANGPFVVEDIKEHHTNDKVHFELKVASDFLEKRTDE